MSWTTIRRSILAFLMVAMGILHIVFPNPFVRAVPSYFPAAYTLVMVSGIFEAALGGGLLFRRTRTLSAYGLVALYLAVFPANVDMALHPEKWVSPSLIWILWARLPFQLLFIYWAWTSRSEEPPIPCVKPRPKTIA